MAFAGPTDRVFVAGIPSSDDASLISARRRDLSEKHGLNGKPVATEHLHVTLWHVADAFGAPPPELIEELVRRMSGIEMPPFLVSFDHVMSFSNGAFVLCGEVGVSGLEMVHQHLNTVLAVKGMRRSGRAFTPHMTLLRDERHVPLQPIEPIDWTVSELVLVHSLLGRTTHRHVARLPLTSRRPFARRR
jgi:RNA 2',3'-cyclic 3'-phosphodiesterase